MRKVWRPIPLHLTVLEMLKIKGGSTTDKELFESIKTVYDVSYHEFVKTLMKLELNGYVRVATAKEGTLIIELIKEGE